MRHGVAVLAVVPARGGSRGIPRKNLRPVGGLSLVGHAVRAARRLPWLDAVVVSTDDEEIASEGRAHGAVVPFMRPAALSGDTSGSGETWQHAWVSAEQHFGTAFGVSLLLQPTSPLRVDDDSERAVDAVVVDGHDSALTVSPTPAHYTPHKSLLLDGDGRVRHFQPDGNRYARRQDIPRLFHPNGLCYAARREIVVDGGRVLGDDCVGVVVSRPTANIDEPFDLEFAEWLYLRSRGGR